MIWALLRLLCCRGATVAHHQGRVAPSCNQLFATLLIHEVYETNKITPWNPIAVAVRAEWVDPKCPNGTGG